MPVVDSRIYLITAGSGWEVIGILLPQLLSGELTDGGALDNQFTQRTTNVDGSLTAMANRRHHHRI